MGIANYAKKFFASTKESIVQLLQHPTLPLSQMPSSSSSSSSSPPPPPAPSPPPAPPAPPAPPPAPPTPAAAAAAATISNTETTKQQNPPPPPPPPPSAAAISNTETTKQQNLKWQEIVMAPPPPPPPPAAAISNTETTKQQNPPPPPPPPPPAAAISNTETTKQQNLKWQEIVMAHCFTSALGIAILYAQTQYELPVSFHILSFGILLSFSSLVVAKFIGEKYSKMSQVMEKVAIFLAITAFFFAIAIPLPLGFKCAIWIVYALCLLSIAFCKYF